MYITCIQLQKLVRPLRMLQYSIVSPQSVENSNLRIIAKNSEPIILDHYLTYCKFHNLKNQINFFHECGKMDMIGFIIIQSLESKLINAEKRIISVFESLDLM